MINNRVVFRVMYVSCVGFKHCDWSTENMRQLDLCGFNFLALS